MEKAEIQKTLIRAFLGFIIGLLFAITFIWLLNQNYKPVDEFDYDKGWSVSVNGADFAQPDTLPEYKFDEIKAGDVVTFKNTLPDMCEDDMTLVMLEYLSAVDVYLDGQLIYTYGHDYLDKNWLVGSGYHFINLPEHSAGSELVVVLTAGENDAFTNMLTPTLSPSQYAHVNYAHDKIASTLICVFLTILGAVLFIVSAGLVSYSPIFKRLLYIGLFSFLMGIWAICNMKILQIFNIDLAANTTAEYLTLYMAPVPFALLIMDMSKGADEWRRNALRGVTTLLTVFAAVATILHYTNTTHFPEVLTYFHVFGAISLVVVALAALGWNKERDLSGKMLFVGVFILSATIGFDLIRFNVQKYYLQENEMLTFSLIPIGALIFIVCLMLSYGIYVYNMLITKAEKDWLTYRAYNDQLCGIYNRAKSTEDFAAIDSSNNRKNYEIINFDVNGLKRVNDTYGHESGDQLLKEFSNIISEAFNGVGTVYRMGGDEFIGLIYEENFDKVDKALELMRGMEKRKSMELRFTIEASYGVARSDEPDMDNTSKVYAKADARMYEMKMALKRNRRLR